MEEGILSTLNIQFGPAVSNIEQHGFTITTEASLTQLPPHPDRRQFISCTAWTLPDALRALPPLRQSDWTVIDYQEGQECDRFRTCLVSGFLPYIRLDRYDGSAICEGLVYRYEAFLKIFGSNLLTT
jgi:hypothetical protein